MARAASGLLTVRNVLLGIAQVFLLHAYGSVVGIPGFIAT